MTPVRMYVVAWSYGDHSGYGVSTVHGSRVGAEAMLKLLREVGSDRQFEIHEVDFYN